MGTQHGSKEEAWGLQEANKVEGWRAKLLSFLKKCARYLFNYLNITELFIGINESLRKHVTLCIGGEIYIYVMIVMIGTVNSD